MTTAIKKLVLLWAFVCLYVITMAQHAGPAIVLELKNESLETAFKRIEQQCGFRFAYRKETVAAYQHITLPKATRSLAETLDAIKAATQLQWEMVKNTIVITPATPKAPVNATPLAERDAWVMRVITGVVKDGRGKPIAFANVVNPETQTGVSTNSLGGFRLELLLPSATNTATIVVSYVDKQEEKQEVKLQASPAFANVVMQDLNLSLKEVQVTGMREASAASNSSVVFGRQAIEQTQPTSIADVLQYLPGQTIMAPDMQNARSINLRSNFIENRLSGSQSFINNAALGTSIIMDGSPISNNANMQMLNLGKYNITGALLNGTIKTGTTNDTYVADYAGTGLDLRQIPAGNIESIEVVSGVASARYGDLTDGAVIVNRQAGATPFSVSSSFREGMSQFQLQKGFNLSKRMGSLNVSADYNYSNNDPRDNTKSYNRINTGLIWTSYVDKHRRWKQTLSFNYTKSLDKTKVDPDDKNYSRSRFNYSSIAIGGRGDIRFNSKYSKNLTYSFRYSQANQTSLREQFVNTASVLYVNNATTSGVHEGEVVPAYNYIYKQEILGKPVSFFGTVENNLTARTGKVLHQLMVGVSAFYDANKGDGWQYDYRKPPISSAAGLGGFKTDRPYTYRETVPASFNWSAFVEDRINTSRLKIPLDLRAGLRYDRQNSFNLLSPRISANYTLSRRFTLNAAYGIATKAPALSFINPGPTYFDYPLIKAFNSINGDNSLYLAYTDVVYQRNMQLKPASTNNYEVGATYKTKMVDVSVSMFVKKQHNGFTSQTTPRPTVVPVYDTLPRANMSDKWSYYDTGRDTVYQGFYAKPVNGLASTTKGIEVMINTRKIKAIQTSFFFATSYYRGTYNDATMDVIMPANNNVTKTALYGVYNNDIATGEVLKSTLQTTHHFPALGFILNFTSEFFWLKKSWTNSGDNMNPVGYYDKNLEYHTIDPKEVAGDAYSHLIKVRSATNEKKSPFYTNFHMRLSKEIGALRISFNAYNVFNIRPEWTDNSVTNSPTVTQLNEAPSYGAELTFKF
ncbi:TonB-dependent Receptor Plug Domain [Filimonas lacunae]|uniref:TonB-dependent Receptor Plug Domain n=1 Tax=Filimonas lacunae TaxID=477680 RepID=A0A173MFL8_9BACT|nr:TonB-dependent receptor [Filimonas lacunae]BAV06277.1 outer membrane protein, nutrient binding [Filimonas lacunae]SIT25610.1 TonB-dependent Receptor Plug Domain [Filimonas lacunae]